MTKLVLANRDYLSGPGYGHMTDEGEQLQSSLAHAGWILAGFGYGDGCTDVPTLIERYKPSIIFIQDSRDWLRSSPGCYNPAVEFKNWQCLKSHPEIVKAMPVKDAGTSQEFQRQFAEAIGLNAAVIYYHERSVTAPQCSPWLKNYKLVRHYHTVDAEYIRTLDLTGPRKRCLVSGAVSGFYPLRQRCFQNAAALGCDALKHPGYGNKGSATPGFLKTLAGYKVSICTASRYNFALRKIIESVACGCRVISDLSESLPSIISDAIFRLPPEAPFGTIQQAIYVADKTWNYELAAADSMAALNFYDYKIRGAALSRELEALCR
jgi:hypothetical protein